MTLGEGKQSRLHKHSSLGLDQVKRLVLPLDIIVLLLHPEDDGGSLTGFVSLVNLRVRTRVLCVWSCAILSRCTQHMHIPPHRTAEHSI